MSHPESHSARGVELHLRGRSVDESSEPDPPLRPRPNDPAAHFKIAEIHRARSRADLAAESLRRAIELNPNYFQAYVALGQVLRQMGRLGEAVDACRGAVCLNPANADARVVLAETLYARGKQDEAAEQFRQALRLDPRNIAAMNNYAMLLAETGRAEQAVEHYRAALAIDPNRAEVHCNLANVFRKQGRIDEAAASYRRTLALQPGDWRAHSNLLFAMNCQLRSDGGLLAEHLEWAKRHAAALYPSEPQFLNDRSPTRRLRVGYVSADFRRHSVAYFFQPILIAHDRNQFEVFCYSNVRKPNEWTLAMRERADQWREITGLSEERVAQMIREDRIDILVDLAGHTGDDRLLVFAHRPAPVQVTYLGYPNTTGLATMDYRITDAESDPPGMTEAHYTERLIRLPHGFLCYQPPSEAPEPRQPSADDGAPITFASFNNLAKVTPQMISLWARLLREVEGSNLFLKAHGLADGSTRDRIRRQFEAKGIKGGRVELLGPVPSVRNHLSTYHRVDIALDTFPYHGTTTTCEALWMGAPVVTLAGRAHVSRVGVSVLTRVGLSHLIANTEDEYLAIAKDLAHDLPRRREISSVLRDRMRTSPLMDAKSFLSALEGAYRDIWHEWCGSTA